MPQTPYKRGRLASRVRPFATGWKEHLNRGGPLSNSIISCCGSRLDQGVRQTLLKTAKKRLKRQPLELPVTTTQTLTRKPVGLRMGKGKGKLHLKYAYLTRGQPLIRGGVGLMRAVRSTTLGFKVKLVSSF